MNYFLKFVRHGLSAVGGVLIAKGIAQPETVEAVSNGIVEIITGGLTFGVSYIWSTIIHKE